MATAAALAPAPRRPAQRVAPLRLARADAPAVDLGRLADEAFAPHHVDDGPLAPVIELRPGRTAVRPRWGRIAALVAALATALALGMTAVADAGGSGAVGETIAIEPGQTLWDVAVEATPAGADPRATLSEIQRINGFSTSTIPAWTPIVLPGR